MSMYICEHTRVFITFHYDRILPHVLITKFPITLYLPDSCVIFTLNSLPQTLGYSAPQLDTAGLLLAVANTVYQILSAHDGSKVMKWWIDTPKLPF